MILRKVLGDRAGFGRLLGPEKLLLATHRQAGKLRRSKPFLRLSIEVSPMRVVPTSRSVLAFLLGLLVPLTTVEAQPVVCSNKTLKGTYLYSIEGIDSGQPYAESGMETFFGDGTLLSRYTENQSKVPKTSRAVYQIDANCHGTIRYDYGSLYEIYVSPDGSSYAYVRIQPSGAVSGVERRVTKQLIQ